MGEGKTLKSLEEFDAERARAIQPRPTKNGIACPKCGEELVDQSPGTVLMCHPARVSIVCEACGYYGSRLA